MAHTELLTGFAAFRERVAPLVAADPVGATVLDTVLAGQLLSPEPGGAPLLVVVTEQGVVAAAALQVTNRPMIVVLDPETAHQETVLAALVGAAVESNAPLSGFTGRMSTVRTLAEQWSAVTGGAARLRMTFRYHRLGTLIPPANPPGEARIADVQDTADLDLLAGWWLAFERETGVAAGAPPTEPHPDSVLRAAERGQVVLLWCDQGRPVAAAGHTAVRDGLARIAPVYTPPQFRRRGFASAVTMAAVQSAQAAGATEVTLFTDADYPAANEVYRLLGFEVVADFAEFEIERSVTGS